MSIQQIAANVRDGGRISASDALALYRGAPVSLLGELADEVRARKHPDGIVTYIIDRNVNYTNVCVARCNFCAFYRPVGSGEGYVLGFEEIFRKIDETIALGGVQLLLQGGHNPDLPIEWYEDLFRAVKQRYPTFKLHALSPPEVIHISRLSRLSVTQVIDRLVAAGLDSVPGGGAEILVDRVRKLLNCYGKATADEWLDVMRQAHRAGLRTTATMMYGHVETVEERLEHLLRLRALQDETGGFTAFITWSYQPEHTELGGSEATGLEYLRMLALSRIVLDNFPSLQASWVTQGGKVGQLSLAFGANDMGSVMIEENVVRAAGASYCMDEVEIVRNIENAGFLPKRRNMHYEILGDPIFRERAIPRVLELAVARADGDTSRAPEINRYAARSAAEKKARESIVPVPSPLVPSSRFGLLTWDCAGTWTGTRAHDPLSRRLGAAHQPPADAGRRRDRGPRPDRGRRGAAIRPGRGSGSRRHPARPRQRAHASRALVDARRGAAGLVDAGLGLDADRASPGGWTGCHWSNRGCDRGGAQLRHLSRRRHQQQPRVVRAAGGERSVGGHLSRADWIFDV